jgi:hypothetical protein
VNAKIPVLIAILSLITMLHVGGADEQLSLTDRWILARQKLATYERYRKVRGDLYDLSPRFYFDQEIVRNGRSQTFAEQPLPLWEYLWGKVLQVADDGILFESYQLDDVSLEGKSELIFIYHFKEAVVDGSKVSLYAISAGRYSYQNTMGARKTILAYDYGEIPKGEELAKLKAEAKERADNYEKTIASQQAAAYAAQSKKNEQGKVAAIKFLKEKAAEGAPMAQYRLAEKYFKGDGVPIDIGLAKFWLQASCTNGYAEASNLLQKIQFGQITAKP